MSGCTTPRDSPGQPKVCLLDHWPVHTPISKPRGRKDSADSSVSNLSFPGGKGKLSSDLILGIFTEWASYGVSLDLDSHRGQSPGTAFNKQAMCLDLEVPG